MRTRADWARRALWREILALPEIVAELVALVFEDVEGLVLDFPSRPAAGGVFGDVVSGDGKAGHQGHGICDFFLGVSNLEAGPIDQYTSLPSLIGAASIQR
jgi:hypothetical protein